MTTNCFSCLAPGEAGRSVRRSRGDTLLGPCRLPSQRQRTDLPGFVLASGDWRTTWHCTCLFRRPAHARISVDRRADTFSVRSGGCSAVRRGPVDRRLWVRIPRLIRVPSSDWLKIIVMFSAISETAYRLPESKASLPKIPVHPIGYGDAYHLLRFDQGFDI